MLGYLSSVTTVTTDGCLLTPPDFESKWGDECGIGVNGISHY
jgi:hypothetical protein